MIELVAAVGGPKVIASVITSVGSVLGPGLQSRARIRLLEAERRAQTVALQQRQVEIGLEVHRQFELARVESVAQRYPLGEPGRLRSKVNSGLAPCLLVSYVEDYRSFSPRAIANSASSHVRRVDGSGSFLQVLTGGFTRDQEGKFRHIDGSVGAAELAEIEFDPHPSLVVYFENVGDSLTAYIRASHLIRTLGGDHAFEMPLARYEPHQIQFAVWQEPGSSESDLDWISSNIDETKPGSADALGAAIALFSMAITSVYWRAQGVRWLSRAADLGPLHTVFAPAIKAGQPTQVLLERLNQDLAALMAYEADMETRDFDDGTFGLYVHKGDRSVMFVVGPEYPTTPPEVLVEREDGEIEQIRLESQHWRSCQSLAEVLEALV